jgi:hypothetical protein
MKAMKTKARGLSKSELPAIRRRLGLTIKTMAQAVGLKLPSYYYYETRYVGEALPDWLADKVLGLARKNNVSLSPRALRSHTDPRGRASARDQALLLRDILRTLHDIRVIMRERGPSAVFVVKDERAGRLGRGAAVNPTRPR